MPRYTPAPDDHLTALWGLLMLPWHRPNYLVAARMGIHPTRLSEYARGKRPIPDRTLIRMCRILDVGPDEILGPFDLTRYDIPVLSTRKVRRSA